MCTEAFLSPCIKYSLPYLPENVNGPYPEPEKSGFRKEVGEARKNKRKGER
jgi:hypothetical protein